jgi:hypothetical protein
MGVQLEIRLDLKSSFIQPLHSLNLAYCYVKTRLRVTKKYFKIQVVTNEVFTCLKSKPINLKLWQF